jgi:hypothetical protein
MWCIKAWNAPINQGNIDIAALAALAQQATEINQGTAKIAMQPFVDAGVDDATIVTPKKLRFGFSISLGTNGYIALPSWLGSFIFQWGTSASIASGAGVSVSLPIAFPNAILNAFVSANAVSGIGTAFCGGVNATSKTAISIYHYSAGGGAANYRWLAVGH